jgi:hypothetical protein
MSYNSILKCNNNCADVSNTFEIVNEQYNGGPFVPGFPTSDGDLFNIPTDGTTKFFLTTIMQSDPAFTGTFTTNVMTVDVKAVSGSPVYWSAMQVPNVDITQDLRRFQLWTYNGTNFKNVGTGLYLTVNNDTTTIARQRILLLTSDPTMAINFAYDNKSVQVQNIGTFRNNSVANLTLKRGYISFVNPSDNPSNTHVIYEMPVDNPSVAANTSAYNGFKKGVRYYNDVQGNDNVVNDIHAFIQTSDLNGDDCSGDNDTGSPFAYWNCDPVNDSTCTPDKCILDSSKQVVPTICRIQTFFNSTTNSNNNPGLCNRYAPAQYYPIVLAPDDLLLNT